MYKERLKSIIERSNITKRNVSKYLGISESCYNHYENESDIMPIKHLIKLCDFFNISADYLFNLTNDKCYSKNANEFNVMESAKRLKEFRKENKLTQIRLADILNVNQSVIANYENGKNIIATPFLYTICKKYNISADYLLGKIDSPKYLKK